MIIGGADVAYSTSGGQLGSGGDILPALR
jgi:hypothetical protein